MTVGGAKEKKGVGMTIFREHLKTTNSFKDRMVKYAVISKMVQQAAAEVGSPQFDI